MRRARSGVVTRSDLLIVTPKGFGEENPTQHADNQWARGSTVGATMNVQIGLRAT